MKSLSFGNIQSLDFSTQDVDYLSQERKNLEYTLQQIARIVPSDDFQGVRQRIVNEDKARDEEDYIQAAANNLTAGKTTAEQTITNVRDYKVSEGSIDTALEKRVAEDMLGDKIVNNEEVYATYLNNPEAYTKDSDYISNLLLADKLYTDYQNIWKNPDNSTKFLAQVGGEFASSILASWNSLGTVVEGTKQGFKINAFKDVLDMDEDILTPTALGHNLRRVLNRYAREKTPEEFSSWIEDKLKPAINSLPMIYQAEVLEWIFEGYQAIDNLWLISDLPDDIGRITKAVDNISTARRAKAVGDFSQSLDSVLVKNEEAISSTAKANVTETSVLKNTDEVKKEVVREATDEAVDNMLDTEDKVFARNLIEEDNVDDISEPVNKAVVDHKNWWKQNMTTIGRADGTPFASEEEAIRAARNIMINRAEEDGFKILSAWSKTDYKTPSLKAAKTGEGNASFGPGLYYTLHKPFRRSNSSGFYASNFKGYMPAIEDLGAMSPKNLNNYAKRFLKDYATDYGDLERWENYDQLVELTEEAIENLQKLFDIHRQKGHSIKETLNILDKDLERSIKSSEQYLRYGDELEALHKQRPEIVQDFDSYIDANFRDSFILRDVADPDDFLLDHLTREVLRWYKSNVKEIKEPVEKFFILEQKDLSIFDQTKTIWNHSTEEVERLAQLYHDKNFWKVPAGTELTPSKVAFYFDNKTYKETFDDVVYLLMEKQKKPDKGKAEKEAMRLFRKYKIGGAWHSDVNLVINSPENIKTFFTNKPTVKGGKVTYQRRIDNPELLKYYTEPVQINGNWYVRVFNGDDNFIKIEGN